MLPSFRNDSSLTGPWPSRRHAISEWMGSSGLVLFSVFSLLGVTGADLGLGLMLLALLLSPTAHVGLMRQPLFWLAMVTMAYIGWRAFVATTEFPEDVHRTIGKQTLSWMLLFAFFIPGWWMSRSAYRRVLGLGLMLGGFVLGGLLALDRETLHQIMHGMRSGLHFDRPIIFGFQCAVGLLAMVSALHYLLMTERARLAPRWWSVVSIILAGTALLLFIQGLIVSQSRGVWLALLIALPLTLILLKRDARLSSGGGKRRLVIVVAGLVLVVLPPLVMHGNTITERLLFERQELGVVVSQGLEQAPLSPSTYRLHLWHFGIETWLKRPLLGWGPGTTQALTTRADRAALKNPDSGSSYDHLHNAYLEVLTQLGLVGLILVAATAGLLLRDCLKGYRDGRFSRPLVAFLLGNLVLIAVYSLTDFRHLHWNWQFYWMILAGVIFSSRTST